MLQQATISTSDLITLVLPAVIGILAGIISSLIATRSKMAELAENFRFQQLAKATETKAKLQVQYLNPLQLAARDLQLRLRDIQGRLGGGDKLLRNTTTELIERVHRDIAYIHWVNDFGHYALSTLYLTNLYFARASRIRSELPFVEMSSAEDRVLLDRLDSVRAALGGPFGIWEDLQDAFGSYIRKRDGSLMDYREFCVKMDDEAEKRWFIRLVDFYRDLDLKTDHERQAMIDSLGDLVEFVATRSGLQARGAA